MAKGSAKKVARRAGAGAKRPGKLGDADGERFLAAYKEAWETRNAALAASLFTRDADYWENPFGEPIVGREAISAYWKAATDSQEGIRFTVHQTLRAGYTLIAEWTCTYKKRPSGQRRELSGVLLADFYGKQVRTFREYWQRRVI
jgi:ketosteroid isomerase-like protein